MLSEIKGQERRFKDQVDEFLGVDEISLIGNELVGDHKLTGQVKVVWFLSSSPLI